MVFYVTGIQPPTVARREEADSQTCLSSTTPPSFSSTSLCHRDMLLLLLLLLETSCQEAEDMIGVVVEVAGRCGLNINMGKCNILLYNHKGIPPKRVG